MKIVLKKPAVLLVLAGIIIFIVYNLTNRRNNLILANSLESSSESQKYHECRDLKFRKFDGICNNLERTEAGTANTPYSRLLPSNYGDGIYNPTIARSGRDLPNARTVSLKVFDEIDEKDRKLTMANMQFGQFVAHDMSSIQNDEMFDCCTKEGKFLTENNTNCFSIKLINDSYYPRSRECMTFSRSKAIQMKKDRPFEQLSIVTAFLDLSHVYGNSEDENKKIREFKGGRLLVENRFKHFWPPNDPDTSNCEIDSRNSACYLLPDIRSNSQPLLVIFQIFFLREHNRIADVLAKQKPDCSDEEIFQEARRINIAQYQHIVYYEWLPETLGYDHMVERGIISDKPTSYFGDYLSAEDPTVSNEFATAAFRYFHSQIDGKLTLARTANTTGPTINLDEWYFRPKMLEKGNNYKFLCRGMSHQPEHDNDNNFHSSVRHNLFEGKIPYGSDLKAYDIQRNRDHGLASYNDFRHFCGLRWGTVWSDYLDAIPLKDIMKLKALYESHEDVELTVGGALENHKEGALVGQTFHCILMEQFYRTRAADRYFYENKDQDYPFSPSQLNEIKKASMARIFCDHSDGITNIQPKVFKLPNKEAIVSHGDRYKNPKSHFSEIQNAEMPCIKIPAPNLSNWLSKLSN